MKENLLKRLNNELELFENQKESDEYLNTKKLIEDIEKVDTSKLEEIAEKFIINGADAWLKLWTNGSIRRIYLNVAYKNGYRPNFKNGFIEF